MHLGEVWLDLRPPQADIGLPRMTRTRLSVLRNATAFFRCYRVRLLVLPGLKGLIIVVKRCVDDSMMHGRLSTVVRC